MRYLFLVCTLMLAGFVIGSVVHQYAHGGQKSLEAVASIYPTKGSTVSGVVRFSENKDGLLVNVQLTGLTPGKHGFHIHEYGDCSCDDALCAGGHFDPTRKSHGSREAQDRHVGDLGSVEADQKGVVSTQFIDNVAKLSGPLSIIGHAVVIHSEPDLGARIACGVIGIAKSKE